MIRWRKEIEKRLKRLECSHPDWNLKIVAGIFTKTCIECGKKEFISYDEYVDILNKKHEGALKIAKYYIGEV
jgi:hypothetical protein